ncbi:MAG: ECF transporter S component [Clostridia bacterium]|nr:ECF transporter S component [Clostridia bacterium]
MLTKINRKRSFKVNTRKLVLTAVLGAIASVMMMEPFSFPIPIMPSYIKMDFSEVPALIASFSMGPISGAAVCLIKNVINAFFSKTGCIGELSNFLLGVAFVVPAGYVYKFKKNRTGAVIASITGSVTMALTGVATNYFIIFPLFSKYLMPIESIIGMYQKIMPSVDGMLMCLLIFNLPFTLVKGLIDSALTFLIYKRISPLIKGKK